MNTSEAICHNYEAAHAKVLAVLDERLLIAEETARFATMGHSDIRWLRHVIDHAEDAASLCRACFEGEATCDGCVAKAREWMEEKGSPDA